MTAVGIVAIGATVARSAPTQTLKVCADPNNLPFSNDQQQGFENEIASLIARELGRRVEYTWWAQRRGFLRNTVNAKECDLAVGVPSSLEMVRRTKPYYRSTYVFVTRRDRRLAIRSLDDSILGRLKVGVPMVGDDYANTPPAAALLKRGLGSSIVPFSVYGDYSKPNPPADLIEAVRQGRVDVAIAWGPLAGYFGRDRDSSLVITSVTPQIDLPFQPMVFDIAMGVRHEDSTFAATLDSIIDRRKPAIDSILRKFGVPRVDP